MQKNIAHQKLLNDILRKHGASSKWRIWANNTGTAFRGDRRISFGLKGSADILGITHAGIFVALEIKTGNAVQSKHQKDFQAMVIKMCGIYRVIRGISEIDQLISEL